MTDVPLAEARKQAREGGGGKKSPVRDCAAEVMAAHLIKTDRQGNSWRYDPAKGYWLDLHKHHLLHLIHLAKPSISASDFRSEVAKLIAVQTTDPDLAWARVGLGELALANGVLDLETGALRPHAPENMLQTAAPWAWSEELPAAPTWRAKLAEWFPGPDGHGLIASLQCFFGYCLMSHARYKKALFLAGPEDTGKSAVLNVLRQLVGTEHCCSLPVDKMDDPVFMSSIVGKALNVLTELPDSAMIAGGGFKQLVSTEEPVVVNPKWKDIRLVVPTCKHAIATNVFPKVTDRTKATYRRLMLIPMEVSVPLAQQDTELEDKLGAEMPGILAWAVDGARKLHEWKGRWPVVERIERSLTDYAEEQNPVLPFLAECTIQGEREYTPMYEAVQLYNRWHEGGRRVTAAWMTRALRSAGCEVKPVRYGKRVVSTLCNYRLLDLPYKHTLGDTSDADGG